MSDDVDLHRAVRRLQEGQAQLTDSVIRIEHTLTALLEGQRSLVEGQTSFRAAMVDELAKTRADIMERLDRQQNSLTDIRADIAVNAASTDSVRRLNENSRDDLRALWDIVTQPRLKIDRLENRVRDVTGDP
jgi:chromosome segregation ATPase